ncbi:MAG: RNA polymerase sigma factor [Clostridiaceae bacterium]
MEDKKLVGEVLKGNCDSFSIIVNKYELNIFKFIYNLTHDRESAQDITQETFIAAYNKLYTYNNKYKFSNWLYQIAKNKTIDYIRKYKRVYESNIEDEKNVISKSMSPEEYTQYKETKTKIEKFIKGLNSLDKEIIILKYSQNLTFEDISIILKINQSAVKRRFYKCREKYKELADIEKERCY